MGRVRKAQAPRRSIAVRVVPEFQNGDGGKGHGKARPENQGRNGQKMRKPGQAATRMTEGRDALLVRRDGLVDSALPRVSEPAKKIIRALRDTFIA